MNKPHEWTQEELASLLEQYESGVTVNHIKVGNLCADTIRRKIIEAYGAGLTKGIRDLEGEIWEYVDDLETYQISNYGRVKKQFAGYEKLVRDWKDGKKHYMMMFEGGANYYYSLHHLVAEYFVPNPKGYDAVGFKDGDKQNFEASNLYWKEGSRNIPCKSVPVVSMT